MPRYDVALINSGIVTINSVGQHANVLEVAANAGTKAALSVGGGSNVGAGRYGLLAVGGLLVAAGHGFLSVVSGMVES